jgi:hypothetical protein
MNADLQIRSWHLEVLSFEGFHLSMSGRDELRLPLTVPETILPATADSLVIRLFVVQQFEGHDDRKDMRIQVATSLEWLVFTDMDGDESTPTEVMSFRGSARRRGAVSAHLTASTSNAKTGTS